jgi:hypothetical protein
VDEHLRAECRMFAGFLEEEEALGALGTTLSLFDRFEF